MATNAPTSSEPRVVSLGDGAALISDYRSWTFGFSRRRDLGRCLRFVVARLSSTCRLLRMYSIPVSQSLSIAEGGQKFRSKELWTFG